MERHERRKRVNLANANTVKEFATQHGIRLRINNNGHHWIFDKSKQMLEWWPSSAKMVMNKKWDHGIHVHDYQQALEQVGKFFGVGHTPAD